MRHGIFFFNFDEKRETFFAVAAKILIRTLQNFYPRREILFSITYIFVDLKKKFSIYYHPVPRRLLYLEREACRQHRGKPFQRCGGQRLSSYSIQFCYFVSVIEL